MTLNEFYALYGQACKVCRQRLVSSQGLNAVDRVKFRLRSSAEGSLCPIAQVHALKFYNDKIYRLNSSAMEYAARLGLSHIDAKILVEAADNTIYFEDERYNLEIAHVRSKLLHIAGLKEQVQESTL